MPASRSDTAESSHCWHQVSMRDFLKICSSAFVPLMIGVMTLVITMQQHKQGNQNRLNDLQIAQDLREQQLQLDETQRSQDREFENNRSSQGRDIDNQRRQQDRELEEEHRRQDLQIAQSTRQDLILSKYLNDMSQLLIEFNFIFIEKVRLVVVRPKTLTALQQLDSSRKTLLVEFLYESNLIRGQHPNFDPSRINLIGADLNNIDMTTNHLIRRTLTYLSLAGSQLINASFQNCNINMSSFESAFMKGASFNRAFLRKTNFYRTSLLNTDFTDASIDQADLTLADLTGSNITDEQLYTTASYHRAILPNGTMAFYENFIRNGDAIDCTLEHWHITSKNSIQIMRKDNECMFQANVTEGDVTLSQKISCQKLRMFIRRSFHYVEVRLDMKKILPSDGSVGVKLAKLFYNEDEFAIGQDETDIDLTKLNVDEVHRISWVNDDWKYLQDTYSIELFIIFHYSLICDHIGLFLEAKRIFDEDDQSSSYDCNRRPFRDV